MFGGIREKFREGIPQGDGDDEFGGGEFGADGSEPGAEGLPDGPGVLGGEDLHESLGDESELHVAVVGGDFSADGVAVGFGFVVQVLIAAEAS